MFSHYPGIESNPQTLALERTAGLTNALDPLPMAQGVTVLGAISIWVTFLPLRQDGRLLTLWLAAVALLAGIWIAVALRDRKLGGAQGWGLTLRHGALAALAAALVSGMAVHLFPNTNGLPALFLGVFQMAFLFTGAFVLSTAPRIASVWVLTTGSAVVITLLREGSMAAHRMVVLQLLLMTYLFWLVFWNARQFHAWFLSTESLRAYLKVIETTQVSVVLASPEARIFYVNPAFVEETGYSVEEVLGQNPRILKSGHHPEAFYKDLWAQLIAGQTWKGEFCNRRKNGSLYWELATISPVLGTFGKISCFVAVKANISALKEGQRLREDVDRMMRHDLRQPLTAIITYPQLLLEEGNLNDHQTRILRRIKEAGLQMETMIDMSMDLFKMEQGTYPYLSSRVDLAAVLFRALGDLQGLIAQKKSRCRLTYRDQPLGGLLSLPVWAKDQLLYSLLSNLLRNALEASPNGSWVQVGIQDVSGVEVQIRNTGAVPLELRTCFFQKYKTSGKPGGTGIGTYSAKLYANIMGFDLTMATSDTENWTEILLFIPESLRANSEPEPHGDQILVEDSEDPATWA